MQKGTYSRGYWDKKVAGYLQETWSQQPSPFAKTTLEHIAPNGLLLELGTGAGQDGVWFAAQGQSVVLTDGTSTNFKTVKQKLQDQHVSGRLERLDVTEPFPFDDYSFDTVYAQLVLHYFDTPTMERSMTEIKRVLKTGGVLAIMVNSQKDAEYDSALASDGMIKVGDIIKRFFTVKTLKPFVRGFSVLLFDEDGRTPKDDAVHNSGMIRFIGVKQ